MKEGSIIVFLILCSMIFSVIAGIFSFKKLDAAYKIFLGYMCFSIVGFAINFFRHEPVVNNIYNYIFNFVDFEVCFFVFLSFLQSDKKKYWINLSSLAFIIVALAEIYFKGLSTYRESLTSFVFGFINIFTAVIIVSKIGSLESNKRKQISKLLILVPFIINITAYIYFNLLLLVLYSPQTAPFFIKTQFYLQGIDVVTYIAFAFAFICLPKKKIFL